MKNQALANIPQLTAASRVLVVGLGKSGLAATKFFNRLGARVSVSEAAPLAAIDPAACRWLADRNIRLETGGHSEAFFTAVDCIMVSPGVPLDLEPLIAARRHHIPVLGEMAMAAQFLKTPVVAVTGTNGKTTVTTLLGRIFKCCGRKVFVGGNIGTPLFDYLCGPQDADIAVLEISSFQLDTVPLGHGFRPDAALLLNITPDHLDRYASFDDYAGSKFRIFAAQRADDMAILNSDDMEIMNRKKLWPQQSRCYLFGRRQHGKPGAILQDKNVLLTPEVSPAKKMELYDLSKTGLCNSPNLENGMAAILTARLMGCSKEAIIRGVAEFKLLEHRMTLVAEINGVRYIDDSKATNIGALQSALAGMEGNILLIAGGRDKGGAYGQLLELIRTKVKTLLLIGEAKEKMAAAWQKATRTEFADSLEEAVNLAAKLAAPGDVVLLSPACSSFDMFTGYVARGNAFRAAVLALEGRDERMKWQRFDKHQGGEERCP